ncbi:MAG: hypothetical protein QM680_02185 [Luteolibacter sp.]
MPRKLIVALGLLFSISISIFVFNSIYQGAIPKIVEEINNSSIGAILTAIITVLLLSQQSSSEEIKERNVRVFEEKSSRFNNFIDKLWEIWEDRNVSLEELNELIKLVSKDIVLYANPERVDKILSYLLEISEKSIAGNLADKDSDAAKIIQTNIFNIINELAKEIGLGGEISHNVRTKLNTLEDRVVPFVIQKDFKKKYIQSVKDAIEKSSDDIDITSVEYNEQEKSLWCRVKNSNLYIKAGPLDRDADRNVLIGAFVDFWHNRNFQQYRDAQRGWRKDYLKGAIQWYDYDEIVNFSNYESIKMIKNKTTDESNDESNDLAKKIIHHYNRWRINGKTIDQIVDECTNT